MELPSPRPNKPPGPIAYSDWMIWKPLPKGSVHGFKKDNILNKRYGAIIINTTTPTKPTKPILTKNDSLTPLTNNKTTIVITITTPVPKSGSNIINPKTSINIPKIGRIPFFMSLISLSFLAKYLDVKIIKLNFINSLGWIPKPPIPNQLLLPFLTVPIPGIKTKINNKKQTLKIMFALFLYCVYGILIIIDIIIYPIMRKNPWVFKNLYGSLNLYSAQTYDDEYIISNPSKVIIMIAINNV